MTVELEHDLGLNVLQRMLFRAFERDGCDELECMAYNVSLDLVLRLFKKYPALKKVSVWSNTERITYSPKNSPEILELIESKRISFFHISENVNAIHSKLYIFRKDNLIQFLAVGSPNFSEHSNQNFESLVYINDRSKCDALWGEIPRLYKELNLSPDNVIPVQTHQVPVPETKMDPKFLEGLWKHQSEILSWLASFRS
jgi:hypothetical protein